MGAPNVPRGGARRPQVGARRKQLGAWYTPLDLVDHLSAVTLGGHRGGGRVTVLDPACGDGRFLAAAARMLGPRVRLIGVDIDPVAVAATRAAVPGAEVVEADARTLDWRRWNVDVVLGNPPFLNQMSSATTRGGASPVGGGPYADVAAEFLAMAVDALGPGGRVGLVLPQSLLTARDAAPIRAAAEASAAVVHAWWSTSHVFDAAVHTCALVLEAGARQGRVRRSFGAAFEPRPDGAIDVSWGALLLDDPVVAVVDADHPRLGSIATFAVDFRDQYYGLVGAVADDALGPALVTSGLIEPGRCLWGERPVRFAKQRFEAPRVDLDLLSERMRRWADLRLGPKILIANQTRRIEAVVDREGEWLPSVPVLTCTTDQLDRVHEVLDSAAATAWVRPRAAGSGLSADALRLTPSLLAGIPLPS